MSVTVTKLQEVPGVLTRWRVERAGKRYAVNTYPDSQVLALETEDGRAVRGVHLLADVRAAFQDILKAPT